MRIVLVCLLFSLIGVCVSGVGRAEDAATLFQEARAASEQGDVPRAMALLSKAITLAPKNADLWLVRAQLYDQQGNNTQALSDYTRALSLDKKLRLAWQRRGESYFKAGKFAESVADFDAFLRLVPDQKPFHWQRGISLYYAGRFKAGKQQFELHQTVNSQDVENAVWHFLCTVRADGLEAARKSLIPISEDTRVPMAQVHQLFAGKARPEEVLSAAQAATNRSNSNASLFYAYLYLGLYYEALNDKNKAREYILKAAERYKGNGYMGEVARVHANLLRKKRG